MGNPAEDDPATFAVDAILKTILTALAFLGAFFWALGNSGAVKAMFLLSLLCFGIWTGWHLNKWKESDGN